MVISDPQRPGHGCSAAPEIVPAAAATEPRSDLVSGSGSFPHRSLLLPSAPAGSSMSAETRKELRASRRVKVPVFDPRMRENTAAAAPGDADDAGSTDTESTVTTDEDLHDECFFDVRAKADEPHQTEQDMGLQECVALAETYLRTRPTLPPQDVAGQASMEQTDTCVRLALYCCSF